MKRLLSFIVFLMFSNAAMAEWVLLHKAKEFNEYFDPATIRHDGNMVKMWTLVDFKKTQYGRRGVYLSQKTQWEYDCQEETTRILTLVDYSGNFGFGTVTDNFTPNKSEYPHSPILPGSLGESAWKKACLN